MSSCLSTRHVGGVSSPFHSSFLPAQNRITSPFTQQLRFVCRNQRSLSTHRLRVCCNYDGERNEQSKATGIQLYREIERVLTETAKQSQDGWTTSGRWSEIEGAWVLEPRHLKPTAVVHFVGGIFVGAAPQITYRLFLERLCEKGFLVIATPYPSGFDHFLIADEVQFKYDRCLRSLREKVNDLPSFGVGHSLGSVIHLLIGSRYAVQQNGNILMSFNSKEPSLAIPLFSPVLVPIAQSIGPLLSQIASSPTVRLGVDACSLASSSSETEPFSMGHLPTIFSFDKMRGREIMFKRMCEQKSKKAIMLFCLANAEMTLKQLENLSPSIMKQVLPLVEQLPPLYMDLVKGREDFSPKPEETRRLVKSYYGITKNLLIKFKDDAIDETPTLAQLLSSDSAISSMLDMSIRMLPGDHGLPLLQALPDVPPAMADAVNRGGEFFANLASGTPWETIARDVGSTLGVDSNFIRAGNSKDLDFLVDVIASWISANTGPLLLRP